MRAASRAPALSVYSQAVHVELYWRIEMVRGPDDRGLTRSGAGAPRLGRAGPSISEVMVNGSRRRVREAEGAASTR
jgi:hypothetical protein